MKLRVPCGLQSTERISWHCRSTELLQNALAQDRKGRVLVIAPGDMPPPECAGLLRDEHSFGLALCIRHGERQSNHHQQGAWGTLVDCSSSTLPFQDEVFRTVILFQVTRTGTEPELDEACRVLTPSGDLLVLGVNRSSWSGMKAGRAGSVPAMQVVRVRNALETRGMVVSGMLGAGLLGSARPRMDSSRISGILLPFADIILLRARHRERPLLTRMRLKEFPVGVVPTALFTVPHRLMQTEEKRTHG